MARGGKPSKRSDEEKLRLFVRTVERCVSRRAIQNGTIRANVHIQSRVGEPVEVVADHGDVEDLRSLVLDVRKFLANDDASFYSICNILERRVSDEETLEHVRHNRAEWKKTLGGQLRLVRDDRTVAGKDLLDVWINGVVFHSDAEDEKLYDELDPISLAMFQQEVNSMVMECLRIVHAQRNVINDVFERGLLGEADPSH